LKSQGWYFIGIEAGHCILVLVSYRFNISTGIRRKNWHDFGMPYLHLVDRVQTRMIQLYDVDPFPRQMHQELTPAFKDIVCVCVGPLNYSDKYVTKGPPDSKLKGNLLLLSTRMQLVCPPLHGAHKYEKNIFNDYLLKNPSPNMRSWQELASIFKEKVDCKNVFPKLPSMLRAYFNNWKMTLQLVAVEDSARPEVYSLLTKFGRPPAKFFFPVLPRFRRNNLILQWEHFLQLSQVWSQAFWKRRKEIYHWILCQLPRLLRHCRRSTLPQQLLQMEDLALPGVVLDSHLAAQN